MVTESQTFADRFNDALDRAGVPPVGKGRQKIVGKMFKVSEIAARKWITGEGMPDTKKLPMIAARLNVTVESLLSWSADQARDSMPVYKADRQSLHEAIDSLPIAALKQAEALIRMVQTDPAFKKTANKTRKQA